MKRFRTYLLVTLLALLAAGQNTVHAFEDTYSFNWTLTANNTSRFIIRCNNTIVFDVPVNRQSSEPEYSYTFSGNESLSTGPYELKLKGTFCYNEYGTSTVSTNGPVEFYVASSTEKINVVYFRRTVTRTDGSYVEAVFYDRPNDQNIVSTMAASEYITLHLNSIIVIYHPDVTLDDFRQLPDDSYEIASEEDWTNLSFLVNDNANSCSGVTFRQTADINFLNIESGRIGLDFSRPFKGTYDGGGKTISYFIFNHDDVANVGLFGYIGEGGTVENVNLRSSYFAGSDNVGGIVGVNDGGTVRNCSVTGIDIFGGWSRAGGIVGKNEYGGAVIGCLSNVSLTANSTYYPNSKYGGIAGFNDGTIQDCLYSGSVIEATEHGSIAGVNNNGTLTNNYYNNSKNTIGGVDNVDVDGARRAHEIKIKDSNVAIDGSLTPYDVSGLTAIGSSALIYTIAENQTKTYSGEGQVIRLTYTGNIPAGSAPAFKVNNAFIAGNSFTMPAGDVAVISALISAAPINVSGHFSNGVYWSTFCHEVLRYALPEGATAYTMDAEHHLYRLGDNGQVIPAGVAVVIISDKETITLNYDSGTTEIIDHAPDYVNNTLTGGNILRGSNNPVPVADITTGTPHVLGVVGGVFGFHPYAPTGSDASIPAHKAYYLQ